jgi:hypothetical protein
MTPRAAATADNTRHRSVAEQVATLPHLSMDDLWSLWDELFDRRPCHHNRAGLENRLAYRLQERACGGLKPSVRKRLEQIGETGIVPRLASQAQQLLPGTLLTRTYNGREHRVIVRGVGNFEWEGRRYKSLSAIARAITGTQWNGLVFFGLKQARRSEGRA